MGCCCKSEIKRRRVFAPPTSKLGQTLSRLAERSRKLSPPLLLLPPLPSTPPLPHPTLPPHVHLPPQQQTRPLLLPHNTRRPRPRPKKIRPPLEEDLFYVPPKPLSVADLPSMTLLQLLLFASREAPIKGRPDAFAPIGDEDLGRMVLEKAGEDEEFREVVKREVEKARKAKEAGQGSTKESDELRFSTRDCSYATDGVVLMPSLPRPSRPSKPS